MRTIQDTYTKLNHAPSNNEKKEIIKKINPSRSTLQKYYQRGSIVTENNINRAMIEPLLPNAPNMSTILSPVEESKEDKADGTMPPSTFQQPTNPYEDVTFSSPPPPLSLVSNEFPHNLSQRAHEQWALGPAVSSQPTYAPVTGIPGAVAAAKRLHPSIRQQYANIMRNQKYANTTRHRSPGASLKPHVKGPPGASLKQNVKGPLSSNTKGNNTDGGRRRTHRK